MIRNIWQAVQQADSQETRKRKADAKEAEPGAKSRRERLDGIFRERAEADYNTGVSLCERGHYQEAISELEPVQNNAYLTEAEKAQVHYFLGMAFYECKRFVKTIEELGKIQLEGKQETERRLVLGGALSSAQRPEEAVAMLESINVDNPNLNQAQKGSRHRMLGTLYFEGGLYEKAIEELVLTEKIPQITEFDRDRARYYLVCARCECRQNQKAMDEIPPLRNSRHLSQDEKIWIQYLFGLSLFNLGKYLEAIFELEGIENEEALGKAGIVHKRSLLERADKNLQGLDSVQKNRSYYDLGGFFYAARKYKKAITALKVVNVQSLTAAKRDDIGYMLGYSYSHIGEYDKAVSELQLIKQSPHLDEKEKAHLRYVLGLSLRNIGRLGEAAVELGSVANSPHLDEAQKKRVQTVLTRIRESS